MNLKKLHEKALWLKYDDRNFRQKATDLMLEQQESIGKLENTVATLLDEIYNLKKAVGLASRQNGILAKRFVASQQESRTDDVNPPVNEKRDHRRVS